MPILLVYSDRTREPSDKQLSVLGKCALHPSFLLDVVAKQQEDFKVG